MKTRTAGGNTVSPFGTRRRQPIESLDQLSTKTLRFIEERRSLSAPDGKTEARTSTAKDAGDQNK